MESRFAVIIAIASIMLFSAIEDSAAEEVFKVSIPKGASVLGCEVKSLCYIPDPIFVSVGDVVEWTNNDSEVHTVASGSPETGADGIIFSDSMEPGEVFAFSFDDPGSFFYYCTIHPWMEGLVTVKPLYLKPTESHEIEQMKLSESGSVIGTIKTDNPNSKEPLEIEIKFSDENYSVLVHMNYDIRIIQDGEDVLLQENIHSFDGYGELKTRSLESDNPVTVIVGLRGIYLDTEFVRPVSETITFVVSDKDRVKKGVSPKAQMENGVEWSDVICRHGLELVKKISDRSVACVTFDSAEKLVQRGWGNII